MKRLTPFVLTIPLLLAGCGEADFESKEQKQESFDKYICQEGVESGVTYGYSYASRVMSDRDSYSKKDISSAFDIMTVDADVVKVEWEYHLEDPSFKPRASERLDPLEDGNCQGWVWEQYREERSPDIEEFTYSDAQEAGAL